MRPVLTLTVPVATGATRAFGQGRTAGAEQSAASTMKFEAASLRLNVSGSEDYGINRMPGGRLTAINAPLARLITWAYGIAAVPTRRRSKLGTDALGHPFGSTPERFQLIAPYETDSRRWLKIGWIDRYSGNTYRIRTTGDHGTRKTARVKTYGDVIEEYEFHPESKCADASRQPSSTRGPIDVLVIDRLERPSVDSLNRPHLRAYRISRARCFACGRRRPRRASIKMTADFPVSRCHALSEICFSAGTTTVSQ